MSTHQQRPVSETGTGRGDLAVLTLALAAALGAWTTWTQAAGVHLTVTASGPVGAGPVVISTLVFAGLGIGLARLLVRRTTNGLRTWTGVAVLVWALSMTGPFQATTVSAGLGLATLHVVVGAVVVAGTRRVHGARAARAVTRTVPGGVGVA